MYVGLFTYLHILSFHAPDEEPQIFLFGRDLCCMMIWGEPASAGCVMQNLVAQRDIHSSISTIILSEVSDLLYIPICNGTYSGTILLLFDLHGWVK